MPILLALYILWSVSLRSCLFTAPPEPAPGADLKDE